MSDPICVEVCVDSVASAIAAEEGGAHRLELCSNLAEGGVTPSAGVIAMVRQQVAIDLRVLIRPRAGDFCYSPDEFDVMSRDVVLAKQLGANGVALGILDADGNVDITRTRDLVKLARPLQVTFHRALDMARDLNEALEAVLETGCDRILTSGAALTAEQGIATIARLGNSAANRIQIVAAGGIREHNVRQIVEKTGVCEVHAALQTPIPSQMRFRNESTTMSSLQGGEYQRFVVLAETVAKLIEAAGQGTRVTS
jgi:copper homeostasis protein